MDKCFKCEKNLFKCRKLTKNIICNCFGTHCIVGQVLFCKNCNDYIIDDFVKKLEFNNDKSNIITDDYEAKGLYMRLPSGKTEVFSFELIKKKSCISCMSKCLLDDCRKILNLNKDKNKFYNDDWSLIVDYYYEFMTYEDSNDIKAICKFYEKIKNDETLKMIIEYNNFLSQNNELKSI